MKEEHDIVKAVLAAQSDSRAADDLIEQYLPFIRRETAKYTGSFPSREDDALSIAMFAFYEAVCSYQAGKGAFLKLASLTIKSRLIDHFRKQQRHAGQLSLDAPDTNEDDRTLGQQIADPAADLSLHQEQADAAAEIAHFSQELSAFGLSLTDIAHNCPKQGRTLRACMQVLDFAKREPSLLAQLTATKKLPIGYLAEGAGVSKKILERHRKYIVAILLAYTNGFEIIRGHLQQVGRKEAVH